jgi:ubiquinone/menaquinone biosynthesis C-methylase UbiE
MTEPSAAAPPAAIADGFDTGSNQGFYDYYSRESLSPQTMQRFAGIAQAVMDVRDPERRSPPLDVLDVGCGAGTQSRFWTQAGHRYQGLDVNEPLIRLARQRAQEQGLDVRFEVGTATRLPFPDASFDVCLLPELLEHVEDWQSCVNEGARMLRPGGVLFISTSSWLCPKQQEFTLPAYSWYPGFVKRYVVRRSLTDWPEVANHAKYPAVHWFSIYQLRAYLAQHGLTTLDRFDLMRLDNKPAWARAVVHLLRRVPPLRLLGHVMTEGTMLVACRPAR